MNSIVDILCRARALYAAAPSHAPAGEDPEPSTHCVVYAIAKGADPFWPQGYMAARDAFATATGAKHIAVAVWNAEHTTEEVLAAFSRAIEAQRLVVPSLQRPERPVPVEA